MPKYSPTSDYPECKECPVRATKECPALYRITEHCPHHERHIEEWKEKQYNPDYQDEEDEDEPIYDFRPSKWEYERRKELE